LAIKFLADHNLAERIVSRLGKSGIDITSVKRKGMAVKLVKKTCASFGSASLSLSL
jgi:hypothetical protein